MLLRPLKQMQQKEKEASRAAENTNKEANNLKILEDISSTATRYVV